MKMSSFGFSTILINMILVVCYAGFYMIFRTIFTFVDQMFLWLTTSILSTSKLLNDMNEGVIIVSEDHFEPLFCNMPAFSHLQTVHRAGEPLFARKEFKLTDVLSKQVFHPRFNSLKLRSSANDPSMSKSSSNDSSVSPKNESQAPLEPLNLH